MNRIDLFEVMSQIARLVRTLLGPEVDLKVEFNTSGATLHIPTIRETTNQPAEPVATPVTVKAPPELSAPLTVPLAVAEPLAKSEPTRKTITLGPPEFETECARILESLETLGQDEERPVDLIPWLGGQQVREIVQRIREAGFQTKIWSWPRVHGRPPKYRHTPQGSARIFIRKFYTDPTPAPKTAQPESAPASEEPRIEEAERVVVAPAAEEALSILTTEQRADDEPELLETPLVATLEELAPAAEEAEELPLLGQEQHQEPAAEDGAIVLFNGDGAELQVVQSLDVVEIPCTHDELTWAARAGRKWMFQKDGDGEQQGNRERNKRGGKNRSRQRGF